MLTEVDQGLLLGAVIACLASIRRPRGLLWIGVAALSYVNSCIAWRLPLPSPEFFTAMGDASVCLAVYFLGRERWEMLIWRLFQISFAISALYLAGNIGVFYLIPHGLYSGFLEAINWLLLLLVGGLGALQWVGTDHADAFRPWDRVRRFGMALREKRASPPFHKVR